MLVLNLTGATAASASDWVFFSAVDDIASLLVQRINAETVRIDMSAWYLTEHSISIALMNRFNAGVQIRLIGDRGSIFEIDPHTKNEFYWLASQGVPIRLRYHPTWYPEIDHWKATIFAGQNLVTFGSANYTPFELTPTSSTNYKDEVVLFSDDPSLVGAFKTKFDQYWNDTKPEPASLVGTPPYFLNWDQACARESACADYPTRYPAPRPMAISTARREPDYPMPPDLIWGQGPAFNNRLVHEISVEPHRVDMVIYRLTVDDITEALLNKFRSGVPVRLIVEPNEYLNRKWPEFWLTHANLDKLWAAGVPMKQRVHEGLTHMKTLVTSSYATIASSNFAAGWQRDHNYFVPAAAKPAAHQAVVNRFQAMWNNAAGFAPFQPQPPDSPMLQAPAVGASGVPGRPALVWQRAPFAVSYDVYLGTSPGSMTWVANVPAQLVNEPPATYSWMPPAALASGTIHYWTIVSRTFANLTAAGPTWSFTTGGSPAATRTPTDLVAAFGAQYGTWMFSGSTWTRLHPLSAVKMVAGDIDGSGVEDLIMDFGPGVGVWAWINHASWIFIHPFSPTRMVTGDVDGNGRDDIVANFYGHGLYRWSDGHWVLVHTLNAENIAIGNLDGTAQKELIADFSGDGIWVLANNATWARLHHLHAMNLLTRDLDGNGQDDLVVDFGTLGIWSYRNNATWTQLHFYSAARMAAGNVDSDARADLVFDFGNLGLWILRNGETWSYLHGYPSAQLVLGDRDNDGRDEIIIDFGPALGLWQYSDTGWSWLNVLSSGNIAMGKLH